MSKFMDKDRVLLAEICRNYPVLTDMGYSMDTVNKKKKAWIKILAEFNALNPGKPPREMNQLKGLWKRIKIKTKADLDALKKDKKKTGGGPCQPALGKPETILSEMFAGQFDPLPGAIDDDAGPFEEGPGEEINLEEEVPIEVADEEPPSYETPNKCSKRKRGDQVLQEELLEMSKREHQEKMEILKIKRERQEIKKETQKLKLMLLKNECQVKNIFLA